MIKISQFTPIAALILALSAAIGTASADLSIAGASFEGSVAPGGHLKHEITVTTDEKFKIADYDIEIYGLGQSTDGSNINLKPEIDLGPYSARSFLSVSPSRIHLVPGKPQKVTVEGDVPQDIGDGGRYALVDLRSVPVGDGPVGMVLEIGVPIKVTLEGTKLNDTGEITDLEMTGPVSSAQNASITFKNTGNHHYLARAGATIEDAGGNTVASVTAPEQAGAIIPTYSRLYQVQLKPKSPLKPGPYILKATITKDDGALLASKEVQFEIKA